MTSRHQFWLALTLVLGAAGPAAATISFETVPGGTPIDGLEISNQFAVSDSVIFRLEDGSNPVLARVSGARTAFAGPPNGTGNDTVLPGQGIGQFFLTDDGIADGNTDPAALIIGFAQPTTATSGSLLDIDDGETVTLQARGLLQNILATRTITAGDPGTGDGVSTFWSFSIPDEEIFSVRIQGTGVQPGSFGLGLDLLNARSAGAPGNYNGGTGQVEQGDLDLVLQNWGVNTDVAGVPAGWVSDLPSGLIEQTELDKVLQNWGSTSAPNLRGKAHLVPEPAAITALLLGMLAIRTKPRHRNRQTR